jgi:hypothetical protein
MHQCKHAGTANDKQNAYIRSMKRHLSICDAFSKTLAKPNAMDSRLTLKNKTYTETLLLHIVLGHARWHIAAP